MYKACLYDNCSSTTLAFVTIISCCLVNKITCKELSPSDPCPTNRMDQKGMSCGASAMKGAGAGRPRNKGRQQQKQESKPTCQIERNCQIG
jgi:hypothetical protein